MGFKGSPIAISALILGIKKAPVSGRLLVSFRCVFDQPFMGLWDRAACRHT